MQKIWIFGLNKSLKYHTSIYVWLSVLLAKILFTLQTLENRLVSRALQRVWQILVSLTNNYPLIGNFCVCKDKILKFHSKWAKCYSKIFAKPSSCLKCHSILSLSRSIYLPPFILLVSATLLYSPMRMFERSPRRWEMSISKSVSSTGKKRNEALALSDMHLPLYPVMK